MTSDADKDAVKDADTYWWKGLVRDLLRFLVFSALLFSGGFFFATNLGTKELRQAERGTQLAELKLKKSHLVHERDRLKEVQSAAIDKALAQARSEALQAQNTINLICELEASRKEERALKTPEKKPSKPSKLQSQLCPSAARLPSRQYRVGRIGL